MTKSTLAALAVALLAGSTFSSAANAGGVRVGFGFPLGSFVAHSNSNYNQSSSYGYKKSCDKPVRAARHIEREEAPVRKAHRPAPKVEVAEKPEPKKIKRAPKVEVAEQAPVNIVKKAHVQTAKLDDKTVTSDAAPTVYVPAAPAQAATPAPVTTAAVTPPVTEPTAAAATAAPVTTAATTTAAPAPVTTAAPAVKDEVKVEAPKAEKIEKVEKDTPKVKISTDVKRLCRRFSAAIAGLIDVPCE